MAASAAVQFVRPLTRRMVRNLLLPRRRESLAKASFLAPVVIYLLVFFAYPFYVNIRTGFENYTTSSFINGVAPFVGLGNYREVLAQPVFWQAVRNTAILTGGSILGAFTIGFGFALYWNRDFQLNSTLRALLLVPWLLPLVVSGTIFRWMLAQNVGVVNQVLTGLHIVSSGIPWLDSARDALLAVTLVNIWVGIPFNFVVMYGGLRSVPQELYEAAAIDGAGTVRVFRSITWPLLRPVTLVVVLLGLIYTIKVFDVIILLTGGGPANATQTLTTLSYTDSFDNFNFGQGAAISNLLIVVALVFAIAYLKMSRRSLQYAVGRA